MLSRGCIESPSNSYFLLAVVILLTLMVGCSKQGETKRTTPSVDAELSDVTVHDVEKIILRRAFETDYILVRADVRAVAAKSAKDASYKEELTGVGAALASLGTTYGLVMTYKEHQLIAQSREIIASGNATARAKALAQLSESALHLLNDIKSVPGKAKYRDIKAKLKIAKIKLEKIPKRRRIRAKVGIAAGVVATTFLIMDLLPSSAQENEQIERLGQTRLNRAELDTIETAFVEQKVGLMALEASLVEIGEVSENY